MSVNLRVEHLRVRLGRADVINDVSLLVNAGEMVAIVGPNGAGKTTLLRAVLGHVAGAGTIEWLGKPLRSFSTAALSCAAGYLSQSPTFDPIATVRQTVLLGRSAHLGWFGVESQADRDIASDVATMLDLNDLMDRPIKSLSGGQRQRVGLARVLAQRPATLVMDEPATFLDLRHQVDLYRLLKRLTREKSLSVLMSAHDLNLAATHCDRLLLLKDGQITRQGTPDHVLDADAIGDAFGIPMGRIDRDGRAMLVPLD
jgi:iron complex transport system ATP-binding protein